MRKSAGNLTRGRSRYPPLLRKLRSQKRCLRRKLRQQPNSITLHTEYRDSVNRWRQAIYDHKLSQESRVIMSSNLGTFYRHVNNRLSHRTSIGPLQTNDGSLLVNDVDIAEAFNTYFAAVGAVDNGIMPHCISVVSDSCTLDNVIFT